MLATILKSKKAIQTTFFIIETFSKLREISRNIDKFQQTEEINIKKNLLEKNSFILTEILNNGNEDLDTETSIELNLAIVKFKHMIKRKN